MHIPQFISNAASAIGRGANTFVEQTTKHTALGVVATLASDKFACLNSKAHPWRATALKVVALAADLFIIGYFGLATYTVGLTLKALPVAIEGATMLVTGGIRSITCIREKMQHRKIENFYKELTEQTKALKELNDVTEGKNEQVIAAAKTALTTLVEKVKASSTAIVDALGSELTDADNALKA